MGGVTTRFVWKQTPTPSLNVSYLNSMSTLRQRKGIINIIQELDAFPKVDEDHREKSAAGGGFSVAVFFLIATLVMFEVQHYFNSGIQYKYDIDSEFDKKLKLNIDMMVAMKCSNIGADILDQTGDNAHSFGNLKEESVNFDLPPEQREQFNTLRGINSHLRMNYHAIHESLWMYNNNLPGGGDDDDDGKKDGEERNNAVLTLADMFPFVFTQVDNPDEMSGCRFRGTLEVNKVAGNFHITAGKSVPVLPRGHAHLSFMMRESEYNFSHRIFHLSFGDKNVALINPLDGEEKIVHDNNHVFQYYIQVVPTVVENTFVSTETYQYAATEQNRTISHIKGSHGMPGIFIKYDLSPLRVTVKQRSMTLIQLMVKLCAIVGGVFATSGLVHHIASGSFSMICCHFGKIKKQNDHHHHHHSLVDDLNSIESQDASPLLSPNVGWKPHAENLGIPISDPSISEMLPFKDL